MRQYIYIPLGGNKKGKIRTYINLMVVFLASGIWHGANWTFVLWGLFRAGSVSQALRFYGRMFTWNGAAVSPEIHTAFYIKGTQSLFGLIGLYDMDLIYLSETVISVILIVFITFFAKNVNA